MVAMLERMAAFHTDLEAYGTTRADVVETTARILHRTATGGIAAAPRSWPVSRRRDGR